MNAIYFMTHSTLMERHAEYCFEGLARQSPFWDKIFVYNTHADELSNAAIFAISNKHGIKIPLEIMDYDSSSLKTLMQDIRAIRDHALTIHSQKSLILKSEYILSKNVSDVAASLAGQNTLWSLPIANAKEFVQRDELTAYASRPQFTVSDEITFYRGSDLYDPHPEQGPLDNGKQIFDTDPRIHFVSHNIKLDFNCHVLTEDVFRRMDFGSAELGTTWGGAGDMLYRLRAGGVDFVNRPEAFAVHVFHEIVSKNRNKDREDGRKTVPGQKY